jgi:ribulose-phosphate 3-epimerase
VGAAVSGPTNAPSTPGRTSARSDRLAASLMCADFSHLARQMAALRQGGVRRLHLDFGDGHFVPNFPLGVEVFAVLPSRSDWRRECHLMIDEPRTLIGLFAPHSDVIVFHLEATADLRRTIAAIRDAGCQVGVALNPGTPAEALFPLLNDIDQVLVMAVEPGFAGGRYVSSVVEKVKRIRQQLDLLGRPLPIEIDGAVSAMTVPGLVGAGADLFVGGTSGLFMKGDLAQNARDLLKTIDGALDQVERG